MSSSVVIFGGSFDPVHKGHIKYAEFIRKKLSPGKMIIMPAAMSPFKTEGFSSDADRINMCRLAFGEKDYEISEFELEKGGKSYTIDTVLHIREKYPHAEIYLCVGSDQLLHFSGWYRYKDILSEVTLCAVTRKDADTKKEMEDYADRYIRPYGDCIIFDFEPFIISSSEIRQKAAEGEDISAYVPARVCTYIKQRGLYRK